MTEREKILGLIREALRIPAPRPGGHDETPPPISAARTASNEARRWLPPAGSSPADWLEQFARNAAELRAAFLPVADAAAAAAKLREIAAAEGWKKFASQRGLLTDAVVPELALPALLTDGGYDVREMERCDAGISECDALIAQTGSVLITSASAGGRALSVLPPHHVVLARCDQLLPDLPSAYELLQQKYGGAWPSLISLITGPSRTGDIERILVLGAHGPKKLTILMW